jgi:hypothetical protein
MFKVWGLLSGVWGKKPPKTQTAFQAIAGKRKMFVKQKALPVAEGFLLYIVIIF